MAKGTGISGKTPGGELLKLIEQNDLSVRATSIALGENQITLSAVLKNKKKINAVLALKLAKVFGNTALDWLSIQQTYDLAEAKNDAALTKQIAGMKKASQIESGRSKAAAKGGAAKGGAVKKAAGKKAGAAKKPAAKKAAGKKAGAAKKADPAL